jgi:hypothetical protein
MQVSLSDVAQGDPHVAAHNAERHAINSRLEHKNNAQIDLAGSTDIVGFYNIEDDETDTDTWPNRLWFQFANKLTSWWNEYGEFRGMPAKSATVAMRLFTKDQDEDNDHVAGGSILEVVLSRQTRTNRFKVTTEGNVVQTGSLETGGEIRRVVPSGPTVYGQVLPLETGAELPLNTPPNTLIVYTD